MARSLLFKRPSPFIFPGGAPRFDLSHPMSKDITSTNGFSGVALGANFVDLQSGLPATIAGAPTTQLFGAIGPSIVYTGATDESQYTNRSTAVNNSNTFGLIFQLNSVNATDAALFIQSINGSAFLSTGIALSAGTSLAALVNGAFVSLGSISFALNVPYFLATSYNTTNYNTVLRRLDTGAIVTASGSGTFTPPASADGSYSIGNVSIFGPLQLDGGISAAMFAPSFHTLPRMVEWSKDPWSFWYPRTLDLSMMLSGSSVATPSGTLATTEAADTAAFSGDISDQGTLAATEGADAAAFSGNTVDSGTLATTEGADTAAFNGVFGVAGSLATTEGADTASFAGTLSDQGALATTEGADAAAFAGSVSDQGALSTTEATDTSAFAGSVSDKGALAVTEAADAAAFAGTVADQGILAATEAADTAALNGNIVFSGTLSATEAPDTASFTGGGVVTGTLATTEASDSAAFAGTVGIAGTLATTEAADQAAFNGNFNISGTFAATEAADILAFNSNAPVSGAFASVESPDLAAFLAQVTYTTSSRYWLAAKKNPVSWKDL